MFLYFSSSPYLGKGGVPGSNDLETALRRLSLRRANEINRQQFRAEDRQKELQDDTSTDTSTTPMQSWTPDSFMSHGSDQWHLPSQYGIRGFLPEKLQIVKPMEGEYNI